RRSGFFLFLALEAVDAFHQHEHGEGDDDEAHHVIDENAVIDGHRARGLCLGQRAELAFALEHHEQIGEIHTAQHQADWRHDHVRDQTLHDGTKGAADDDPDSHVHYVALDGKFPEFLHHAHALSLCRPDWRLVCRVPFARHLDRIIVA